MKKIAIILTVVGLISALFATTMTVHTTSGDEEFEISEITSITFSGNAIPTDYVAYYPFDENANDYSGNNSHGSILGGAGFEQGLFGNAISLNGINQYVRVSNTTYLNPDCITLSAWIRLDALPADHAAVIQKYNDGSDNDIVYQIIFSQSGDGSIGGGVQTTTGNRPSTEMVNNVEINNWFHLVLTFNGSELITYINNNPSTPVISSGFVLGSDFDVSIGRGKPLPGRWIDGLIDDVRIYNRALSEEEIQALYYEVARYE